jgi:hypothetical protein
MVIKGRPCKVRSLHSSRPNQLPAAALRSSRQMQPTAALLLQGWLDVLDPLQQQ